MKNEEVGHFASVRIAICKEDRTTDGIKEWSRRGEGTRQEERKKKH